MLENHAAVLDTGKTISVELHTHVLLLQLSIYRFWAFGEALMLISY